MMNLNLNFSIILFAITHFSSITLASGAQPAVAGKVISVSGTVLIRTADDPKAKSQVLKPGTYFHSSDIINTPSDGTVKLLFNDRSLVDVGPSTLFQVKKYDPKQGANREVDVSMIYGSIRAAITKPLQGQGRFKLRTPTATMGVRGTEFVVRSAMGTMAEVKHGIKNPGTPMTSPRADVAAASSPQSLQAAAPAKMEVVVVQGKVDVETPRFKTPDAGGSSKAPAFSTSMVSLTAGQALRSAAPGSSAPVAPITLSSAQMSTAVASAKVEDNTFKKSVTVEVSQGNIGGSAHKENGNGNGNSARAKSDKETGKDKDKADKDNKKDKSEKSEGSRTVASTTETSTSTASTSAESASSSNAAGSTMQIVEEMVVASVAPTAPTPVVAVDAASFIPVTQVTDAVVIPAGGLKRVTITISR